MARSDFRIEINHNQELIKNVLENLSSEKEMRLAVNHSLKRTAKGVAMFAINSMNEKKVLRLNKARMGKAILTYFNGGASSPVSEQSAKVFFTSVGQPLGRFYARRVSAGKSKALMKQNKYGAWPGVRLFSVRLNAFGAPYLSDPKRSFIVQKPGGPLVFKRLSEKRLDIQKQLGPSLSDLIKSVGLLPSVEAYARDRYSKEITHNVKFYTERAIARALAKSKTIKDPESECLFWTGANKSKRVNAHGHTKIDGRYIIVSRLVYVIFNGEISSGLFVCHTCDKGNCINPKHLFLGTHTDNMQDCLKKGRFKPLESLKTHCNYGHEFNKENIYRQPGKPGRKCRACRKRIDKCRKEKKKKLTAYRRSLLQRSEAG